jgi:AraC-like DNA-binding protein/ligand-binding sensor protein
MDKHELHLTTEDLESPALERLTQIAYDLAGIRFLIVFPQDDGWGQIGAGAATQASPFCKRIHDTIEGAQHCRMCHILMSVAACNNGPTEQTCHSGASVLVAPIHHEGRPCFALLSSCAFAKGGKKETENEVRQKAIKLGLDEEKLFSDFKQLPELASDTRKLLLAIMEAIGLLILENRDRREAQRKLAESQNPSKYRLDIRSTVETELKESFPLPDPKKKPNHEQRRKGVPPLIEVITTLVSRKPNMPFSVSEIAAAARITPNHFSTLFHQHVGQSFSAFLTEKRIDRAKDLLSHLTLNITEVATMSGYDDPGYFARVFKKSTGTSPREWRQSLRHHT